MKKPLIIGAVCVCLITVLVASTYSLYQTSINDVVSGSVSARSYDCNALSGENSTAGISNVQAKSVNVNESFTHGFFLSSKGDNEYIVYVDILNLANGLTPSIVTGTQEITSFTTINNVVHFELVDFFKSSEVKTQLFKVKFTNNGGNTINSSGIKVNVYTKNNSLSEQKIYRFLYDANSTQLGNWENVDLSFSYSGSEVDNTTAKISGGSKNKTFTVSFVETTYNNEKYFNIEKIKPNSGDGTKLDIYLPRKIIDGYETYLVLKYDNNKKLSYSLPTLINNAASYFKYIIFENTSSNSSINLNTTLFNSYNNVDFSLSGADIYFDSNNLNYGTVSLNATNSIYLARQQESNVNLNSKSIYLNSTYIRKDISINSSLNTLLQGQNTFEGKFSAVAKGDFDASYTLFKNEANLTIDGRVNFSNYVNFALGANIVSGGNVYFAQGYSSTYKKALNITANGAITLNGIDGRGNLNLDNSLSSTGEKIYVSPSYLGGDASFTTQKAIAFLPYSGSEYSYTPTFKFTDKATTNYSLNVGSMNFSKTINLYVPKDNDYRFIYSGTIKDKVICDSSLLNESALKTITLEGYNQTRNVKINLIGY